MAIMSAQDAFKIEIERADPLRIQVAHKLRQLLRLGNIPPGTRLTERAVADMLGVSRTPAREALGVLAESGVLDAMEQGGYVVPKLTSRDIDELYEARALLEIPALKASIRAADQGFVKKLADCIHKLSRFVDDYETVDFLENLLNFRRILLHNCGNELVYRMILELDNHTESLKIAAISDPEMRIKVIDVYGQMVDAVARRDQKAAVALLRRHHADGKAAYHAELGA